MTQTTFVVPFLNAHTFRQVSRTVCIYFTEPSFSVLQGSPPAIVGCVLWHTKCEEVSSLTGLSSVRRQSELITN